jgi:hypothetical protein
VNWAAFYVHVMTIYILTESLPMRYVLFTSVVYSLCVHVMGTRFPLECLPMLYVRFTSVLQSLDLTLCARDGNSFPFRMLTSVVRPLYYTLRACDVGRQADFVPEDCLFLGLEGNVVGHVFCI